VTNVYFHIKQRIKNVFGIPHAQHKYVLIWYLECILLGTKHFLAFMHMIMKCLTFRLELDGSINHSMHNVNYTQYTIWFNVLKTPLRNWFIIVKRPHHRPGQALRVPEG
jgi:hypothetical protein